jgi:hypothetical protein
MNSFALSAEQLNERIAMALGAMGEGGPRNLRAYLAKPGPDVTEAGPNDVDKMIDLLLSSDPNHPARLRFSHLLRFWDNVKDGTWTDSTQRNTSTRRGRIHELLRSPDDFANRVDSLLPFYRLDEPLVIATAHTDWYKPSPGIRDYYWRTYCRYLRESRSWSDESLLNLDNTTRAIVECLADPESSVSYASRGLVMGYVQSGKTANFMGVVARAADAGYRLIIVLAGTWNILRNQTQRRFDKELLGKELLANDESYCQHPPADWDQFLEHGAQPVDLGYYTWQRLTRPDIDFRRLKAAIDTLEFEKRDRGKPLYHPINLHALPAKLLIVKKHSGILASLVKDLKIIRTRIQDLPTLIIDDESDQAGLNTVDPRRSSTTERSRTNQRIVELLRLFPRGQYVGYTATPYANALVDPSDPEDLFPKDFIVSLDRPSGYMGVSDFFDPLTDYDDLDKEDYSLPEIAYIRRIERSPGDDDEDLKNALRSYVLAGAVKLFRQATDETRYRAEHIKHHTMLIHTSVKTGEQAGLAERLRELWDACALNSPSGREALEQLWNEDHRKVSTARGDEITPSTFSQLVPHLSEAIKRIEKGPKIFHLVNSDTAEAPDFSTGPVWKIVIGGNKLSRGYTIEGLTVSYYRRVAGTADTLMQMGRWFGFRPGYRDLVRVFLGVAEGKKHDTDLVSLFKEVCRMEESFREEIKRYMRKPGERRITPREIPPLISVSGTLPPTAGNKMFNAVLATKNFGGQWSMLTLTPAKPPAMDENIKALENLLTAATSLGKLRLGGQQDNGDEAGADAIVSEATTAHVIAFLTAYRWLETEYPYPERPADAELQIEFLQKQSHGIASWLVVAPQRRTSFGPPLQVASVHYAVKKRRRVDGRRFQVFGEPAHRCIAEYLTGVDTKEPRLTLPNADTEALRYKHRGVLLLYPVREEQTGKVSVGFELIFPNNDLPFDVNFTVRRKADSTKIVVENVGRA